MDKKYKEFRQRLKNNISKNHKILEKRFLKDYEVKDLPDNFKIQVVIYYHKDNKNRKTKYWNIAKFNVFKDEKHIFTFYRNYSSIHIAYGSYNGKDYLFTGEDYSSLCIINLTDKTIINKFFNWCITDINGFNEEDCRLSVNGCYWGCEAEETCRWFYFEDLDNPIFNNKKNEIFKVD